MPAARARGGGWGGQILGGFAHMYGSGEFARSHWCSSCHPHGTYKQCPPAAWSNFSDQFTIDNGTGVREYRCEADNPYCWCRAQLDPEGVLSSVPTVLTTWLGLHFGLVLVHKPNHAYRLKHWAGLSTAFLVLGFAISPAWGMCDPG
jgi:hypothetical protein